MRNKVTTRVGYAAALAICFCVSLFAQQFRGTISGLVTDQQGAVIPGAQIVATQLETGAKSQSRSNAAGQFNLPFLAPGLYTLSVEAKGFKQYRRERLLVSTNEEVGLEVKLQIGEATESITISADAPLLQTE